MNDVEKVKQICKERKIAISKLEKDLGFANGYVGQLKKGFFPSDRAIKISTYLGIELTGAVEDEIKYSSEDTAKDEHERTLLMLCRNAADANPENKKALVDLFQSTIELYKKTTGIK